MTPPADNLFTLGRHDFERIAALVQTETGIHLGAAKMALVESRLARRIRAHALDSFSGYVKLLGQSEFAREELPELINCITTNKTSFFREPHHFDFMLARAVPELVERARRGGPRRIRIWSAGCSMGQEPYTIAMVLREALGSFAGWDVKILASDIDTDVLAHASRGVYEARDLEDVPSRYAKNFVQLGSGEFEVQRSVRELVTFRQVNLITRPWPIRTSFDLIFCRNVVIYFERATQQTLYAAFHQLLDANGYLVAGHSENLNAVTDLFTVAGRTIYRPRTSGAQVSIVPRSLSLRPPAGAEKRPSLAPRGSLRPSLRPRHSAHRHSLRPPPARHDVAIHAGGLHVGLKPTRVRTVLGSCVSACLYDPGRRIGGVNHFMLPDGSGDAWLPARFGVHAMELLINTLMRSGASRNRLVAKVFGAASVLRTGGVLGSVSERNRDFILKFMEDEHIPIVAQKLGGSSALLLHFETDSGRALVRKVESSMLDRVVKEESKYLDEIRTTIRPPEADVTLF